MFKRHFTALIIVSILLPTSVFARTISYFPANNQAVYNRIASPFNTLVEITSNLFVPFFNSGNITVITTQKPSANLPVRTTASNPSTVTKTVTTISSGISRSEFESRLKTLDNKIRNIPGTNITFLDLINLENRLNDRIIGSISHTAYSLGQNITNVYNSTVGGGSSFSGLLSISQGGTGLSTAPSYGQVLVGDGAGGYALMSTSSLNILGSGSSQWTTSGANIYYTAGNVGIGTTSPYAPLSVNGQIVAAHYTATTSATSTFAGGIQTNLLNVTSASASSTFANGIRLSAGCFEMPGGVCAGGSNLTGSGAANRAAYWTASGNLSYSNDFVWDAINSRFGIGSTTPFGQFSINTTAGTSSFVIGSSTGTYLIVDKNGNVGIGTTSPYAKLSVAGEVAATKFTASTTATSTLPSIAARFVLTSMFTSDTTNSDSVSVGMLSGASVGAANWGITASPYTSTTILYVWHPTRIRQTGDITACDVGFVSKPSQVTSFYIQFWRRVKNTNTWVNVASSTDLWPSTTGGQVNTFTFSTPLGVQEGDFPAIYYTMNGSNPGQFMTSVTSASQTAYYAITNTVPTTSGYDFTGGTAGTDGYSPIRCYERAPMFVTIGDSIIGGANDSDTSVSHRSYYESTDHNNREHTIAYKIGQRTGWNYQNAGIAGDGMSGISSRFATNVLAMHPRWVLIEGGSNDLATLTQAQFLAYATSTIAATLNAGAVPVYLKIPPTAVRSDANMLTRDAWMSALRAELALYYPQAIFVDVDPLVGKYRSTGTPGNLWDIAPQYTDDFLHYSPQGYAVIAEAVVDALSKQTTKGKMETGDLKVNGNIIVNSDGKRGGYIRAGLPSSFDQLAQNLTIEAGRAFSGQYSLNRDGGNLFLSGGASVGTGTSRIDFLTAPAGSSGGAENAPTIVGSFLGNGNFGIGSTTPYEKLGVVGNLAVTGYYNGTISAVTNSYDISRWGNGTMGYGGTNDANAVYLERIDGVAFGVNGGGIVQYPGVRYGLQKEGSWNVSDTGGGVGGAFVVLTSSGGSTASLPTVTEKFRISSTGNVGIGTTSPYAKLSVVGQVAAEYFTATSSTAITSFAGKVGIGTTSPWAQFSINPNAITGPAFVMGSSTATKFIVTNGGNVGIGTTSPSSIFSVTGSGYFTGGIGAGLLNTTAGTIASSGNGAIGGALTVGTVPGANPDSSFSSYPTTGGRNDISFAVGMQFRVNSTVTVSRLGRLYFGANSQNHVIKLWISTNQVTPLASATILAASASDAQGFKWVDITPVVLSPGNTYAIAIDENNGGDQWTDDWTPSLDAAFTPITSAYRNTQGGYPSSAVTGGNMYSSPAMAYTNADPTGLLTSYGTTADSSAYSFTAVNSSGSALFSVRNDGQITVKDSGNFGIATTTPWRKLSVTGTVAFDGLTSSATGNALCITSKKDVTDAGGGTCTPSSIRFKENITTMNSGEALDKISRMRVVNFDYKEGFFSPEDGNHSLGLIAEEVETIDPRLVDYGYDGKPLTLHFERVTGLTVQAIQELNIRLDALEAMNASSTQPSSFLQSIGAMIQDGILHLVQLVTDRFTTKELCVEDICVTKDQFKKIVEQANGPVIPPPPPPPEPEPQPDPAPEEIQLDPGPVPDSSPAPEPPPPPPASEGGN